MAVNPMTTVHYDWLSWRFWVQSKCSKMEINGIPLALSVVSNSRDDASIPNHNQIFNGIWISTGNITGTHTHALQNSPWKWYNKNTVLSETSDFRCMRVFFFLFFCSFTSFPHITIERCPKKNQDSFLMRILYWFY